MEMSRAFCILSELKDVKHRLHIGMCMESLAENFNLFFISIIEQ